jgi:hypothetical protein
MSLVMTSLTGEKPKAKVIDPDAEEKKASGKAAVAAKTAAAAKVEAAAAEKPAAAGKHGDCAVAHKKAGCSDKHLAKCVCARDSWCCDIEWDSHCAKMAGRKDICSSVHEPGHNASAVAAAEHKVAELNKAEKKHAAEKQPAAKTAAAAEKEQQKIDNDAAEDTKEAASGSGSSDVSSGSALEADTALKAADNKLKAAEHIAEDAIVKGDVVEPKAPISKALGRPRKLNETSPSPKDVMEQVSSEEPKPSGKFAAKDGANGHHCFQPGNCTHAPTRECTCQHDSTCCADDWEWDTLCSSVANYLCHAEAEKVIPASAKKAKMRAKIAAGPKKTDDEVKEEKKENHTKDALPAENKTVAEGTDEDDEEPDTGTNKTADADKIEKEEDDEDKNNETEAQLPEPKVGPEPPQEDPKELLRKVQLEAQRKKAKEVAAKLEEAMAAKEARDAKKHFDAKNHAAEIRARVSHDAMNKAKKQHLGKRANAETKEEVKAVTETFIKKYKEEMEATMGQLKKKAAKSGSADRLEEARKLAASPIVTSQLLKNNFHKGAKILTDIVTAKREPTEVDDAESKAVLADAKKKLEQVKAGIVNPIEVKNLKRLVIGTLNASKAAEKLKTQHQKDLAGVDLLLKQLTGDDKDPAANTTAEDAPVIKIFNATFKKGNDKNPGFNLSKGDSGDKADKGDPEARARRALARIAAGNYSVSEKLAANEVQRKAKEDELDEAGMIGLMTEKMNKAKENADGFAGPGVVLVSLSYANDSIPFRIAFKQDVAAAVGCKESRVKIDAIKSGMVLFYFTGNKNDSSIATGPALKDDFIDLLEENKVAFKAVARLVQMPIMSSLTSVESAGVFNKTNISATGMGEATGRSLSKVLGVLKKLTKPGKKHSAPIKGKGTKASKVAAKVAGAKAKAVAAAKAAGKTEAEQELAGEEAAAAVKVVNSPEEAKKAAHAAAKASGKSEEEASAAAEAASAEVDGSGSSAEKEAAEEEVGEIDDNAPSAEQEEADAHNATKKAKGPLTSKLAGILANLTRIPGVSAMAAASGVNMTEVAQAEEEASDDDSIATRILQALKSNGTNGTNFTNGSNITESDEDADDHTTATNSVGKKITASSGIRAALMKLGLDQSNDAVASTVVNMALSIDFDWVSANKDDFTKAFAKDISAALSIDQQRIDVTKVRPGSTIVEFTILSALTNETADANAEQSSSALAESLVHMGSSLRLPMVEVASGIQSSVESVSWKVMEVTSEEDKQAAATDAIASKISQMVNGGSGCNKTNSSEAVIEDDEVSERKEKTANISSVIDRLLNSSAGNSSETDLSAALASLQAEQKVRESSAFQELTGVLNATGANSTGGFNLTEALNSSVSAVENGSDTSVSFIETGRPLRSVQRSRWMSRIFASLSGIHDHK